MQASEKSIGHFESATALVGGITLHYWLGGDPNGPPILLWHGFLGTSYSWHKVMPLLVEAGYRVLVPDMRGYGDSDKPKGTKGYDGRALAEEFRLLIRTIGFGAGGSITIAAHDIFDLLAEGRLRQKEALCCASKISGLSYRCDVLQMSELNQL
jgi:hypothetical protein